MKKYIGSLMVLFSGLMFSQSILNASSPEEFRKMRDESMRKVGDTLVSKEITPLSYGYVNDEDVFKSVMVWEIIDLNDKLNQPFYYNNPDGLLSASSKSLYNVLLDAAMSGKITEIYDDENFSIRLDTEQIKERLVDVRISNEAINILNEGRQLTEQERKELTDIYKTESDRVRLLKVLGMWFIDKRDGMMKYRPLGIAAVGPDPKMIGRTGPNGEPLEDSDALIDLFWIYYPNARTVLANNMVYNQKNASSKLSFDDLINGRRFSTVIYKSTFGVGDGKISDYIPRNADEQLEESDRIKAQILAMENEMWNY